MKPFDTGNPTSMASASAMPSAMPSIGTVLEPVVPVASLPVEGSRRMSRDELAGALAQARADMRTAALYERAVIRRWARMVVRSVLQAMIADHLPPSTATALADRVIVDVCRAWQYRPYTTARRVRKLGSPERRSYLTSDLGRYLRGVADDAWWSWARALGQPVEFVIARANQARDQAASDARTLAEADRAHALSETEAA